MARIAVLSIIALFQCFQTANTFRVEIPRVVRLASLSTSRVYSNRLSQVEDDGYTLSNDPPKGIRAFLKRLLFKPKSPGTLILVRHGESEWNSNGTFTGWVDVDMSERGRREVEHAARLLLEQGHTVDVVYTSRLKRAIKSTWILIRELNQIYRPVYKSYRLNERMYGALEGLSKAQVAKELGKEIVQSWRGGLLARPPPMQSTHLYWHRNERKYADLSPEDIPLTESLQDTMERTLPLWHSRILPTLKTGKNVMIVAHGNSLRGIVKHIDGLTAEEIQTIGIPNGIPLVYKFNDKMEPIKQAMAVAPLTGEFLEKKGLLRAALEKEQELAKNIPGYDNKNTSSVDKLYTEAPPLDPYLRTLTILKQEKQLLQLVKAPSNGTVSLAPGGGLSLPDEEDPEEAASRIAARTIQKLRSQLPAPTRCSINGSVVVIMRHGKTVYNKLGLFTGWEDAPLDVDGRVQASAAGKLLKAHGIEFDVVYTSWLSRAIETAWLVLNELDSIWLPIIKTWRLNERMYGALTGLSKKMVGQRHGDKQLKAWRRGYDTRPPKISSFSSAYPGNDERYVKYVRDMRVSISESVIRSLAHGRFEIHRKFPKTESLKDCMERTIPYYKEVIYPESIAKNKKVLIASSENAIRGLLMYLCDVPIERVHEIEIPTGLPLVFDLEKKCIKLLDDGTSSMSLSNYNFGTSPELLFRPCDVDKNTTSCFIDDNGIAYAVDPFVRLPW